MLFILDYGAGNVASLSNSIKALGYSFRWIETPEDFDVATSLIFPGVGAFESAILHLSRRGLLEPLRQYILSGRPYFGICIGMQILFESSEEATSAGLGMISCPIRRFRDDDKTVPHIGWNTADSFDESPAAYYYFVHSYCAPYDPEKSPNAAEWAHTTTLYGQEIFISSVKKDNVFGTQFHPEKSGKSGLALLNAWLGGKHVGQLPSPVHRRRNGRGLTKRIVACMDVRANDQGDLVVTKGDQYDVREKVDPLATTSAGAVRNLGKPVALAAKYYDAGADELCLLNITSFRHSPLQDQPMLAVVKAAAERLFIPLTIGGGIKDTVDPDGTPRSALEVASAYFRAGADKVSIGSEAVYAVERWQDNNRICDGTSAIETIAHAYGRQAVVVSIDPRRKLLETEDKVDGNEVFPDDDGNLWWYQCTVSGGREARPLSVVQLARGAEALGAGELLVNSIDRDGTGLGFDLELLSLVKRSVRIPVVASSGAGNAVHFVEAFQKTNVEAALAAGIFHREEVGIQEVKDALHNADIHVRD
ncbi:Imidazole glycerol phosphate synthase hisHF [Mycena indigotica]|uniref:Imidazole glycerol phosphate synthase hisHF n=1 Tax=Mycena indigotica TaxID=2126181 RepID=A0A8H6SXE1_9AGAR|nr:Imidazole glycerol phosphate synthase hisHF [Mycena indigotica]KAF7306870.1 Imidazole glycerol phosphate synthase hisHF [Mycena indigotica]